MKLRPIAISALSLLALTAAKPAMADMDSMTSSVGEAFTNRVPTGSYNWTGFYGGMHVGAMWGSFSGQSPTTLGPSGSASDIMGGIQGGYNFQKDRLVYGGEIDFSLTPNKGRGTAASFEENWTSTIRGRAGYMFGNWLPYGTLGLGMTNAVSEGAGGSINNTHVGFTVGAGADYAVYNNLSVRAEYLYVDVPEEDDTINGAAYKGGATSNIIRIGANYHFR